MGSPLPVSARDVHRIVPSGCDAVDPTAPVYLLKTPNMHDKARIERSIGRLQARPVAFADLMDGLRAAARELLVEPELSTTIGQVDAFEQHVTAPREAAATATEAAATDDATPIVPDAAMVAAQAEREAALKEFADLAQTIDAFEQRAIASCPAYAALLADRDYWWNIARTESARQLLIGWENVDVPFARGGDGVLHIDVLSQLDTAHVFEVGLRARELLTISPRQRGN